MTGRRAIITIIATMLCAAAFGQRYGPGYYYQRQEVRAPGDTLVVIDMLPLPVFAKPIDLRRYQRLIRNLKIVYPIAKEARRLLAETEAKLDSIPNKRQQQEYVKQLEKDLKQAYTPILKKMTFSQGKILIKLIDRETSRTSYELVRELRGKFSAFFWQGIARLFGANLKDQYDKEGEDRVIEQLIIYYEAGLL